MVGDRASPGAVLELLGPNLPSRLCVRVLTCMKDAEASRLEDAEPQDGHHSHCAAGKRAGGPGRGGAQAITPSAVCSAANVQHLHGALLLTVACCRQHHRIALQRFVWHDAALRTVRSRRDGR